MSNQSIDRAFKEALSEGVFPAAEVLVAKNGEVLYAMHYGDSRLHTCFDISSLTKPFCTSSLAMMLFAEGLLKDTDTVYQWLAGAREPHHKLMNVMHLIEHSSGLPSWQPYYRELPQSIVGTEVGKRLILDSCYAEPLLATPGKKTIYSDLGYMLLGEIIEQAGGERLDELFMQRIARPLKLMDTFFVRIIGAKIRTSGRRTATTADQHVPTPKHGFASERPKRKEGEHLRFASTEDCPWRGRVIHGEVHDQNAYALGGVAGHAGLFSTADDIHKFLLGFARCYRGKSDFVPPAILQKYIGHAKQRALGDEYVFGWNRPSPKESAAGHHFSANSIGHMGFTGCSMWVDLDKDFWIILLTNRIHPTTMNEKIKSFRPYIHDLIYDELLR